MSSLISLCHEVPDIVATFFDPYDRELRFALHSVKKGVDIEDFVDKYWRKAALRFYKAVLAGTISVPYSIEETAQLLGLKKLRL